MTGDQSRQSSAAKRLSSRSQRHGQKLRKCVDLAVHTSGRSFSLHDLLFCIILFLPRSLVRLLSRHCLPHPFFFVSLPVLPALFVPFHLLSVSSPLLPLAGLKPETTCSGLSTGYRARTSRTSTAAHVVRRSAPARDPYYLRGVGGINSSLQTNSAHPHKLTFHPPTPLKFDMSK